MARLAIAVGFPPKGDPEVIYIGYDRASARAAIEDAVSGGDFERGEMFANLSPSKKIGTSSVSSLRVAQQKRSDAINAEAKKRLAAFVEEFKKDPINGGKAPTLDVQRRAMTKFMAEIEAATPPALAAAAPEKPAPKK